MEFHLAFKGLNKREVRSREQ